MHLADARQQIQRILDPRFAPAEASAGGALGGRPGVGLDEELAEWLRQQTLTCWPEMP